MKAVAIIIYSYIMIKRPGDAQDAVSMEYLELPPDKRGESSESGGLGHKLLSATRH